MKIIKLQKDLYYGCEEDTHVILKGGLWEYNTVVHFGRQDTVTDERGICYTGVYFPKLHMMIQQTEKSVVVLKMIKKNWEFKKYVKNTNEVGKEIEDKYSKTITIKPIWKYTWKTVKNKLEVSVEKAVIFEDTYSGESYDSHYGHKKQ